MIENITMSSSTMTALSVNDKDTVLYSQKNAEWINLFCPLACKNWPVIRRRYVEIFDENGTKMCNNMSSEINESEQQEFSYILAFAFGVPATFIIILTVFGNLLVLCFKARVGKTQTTFLVWNLGLADFLVGIFVLPLGVCYVIGRRWPFGRLMCRIWACCDVIFCTASIVTLCIISVDRYIGVTKPLRYKSIVTKTKVKVANVGIWLFSISILLATVRYDDKYDDPNVCSVGRELQYVIHSVIFAFFLPTIITLMLYFKIYSIVKRREKGIVKGLMMVVNDNLLRDYMTVPLRIHCGKKTTTVDNQQQTINMQKKVAKTLGVVVGAFLLCWLPFFCLYLIGYQCDECIPGLVLDITTWLGYCNSCINPLIYAYTITEFRVSLKTFISGFGFMKKQKSPNNSTSILESSRCTLQRSDRAYSLRSLPTTGVEEKRKLMASIRRKVKSQSSINTNCVANGDANKNRRIQKVTFGYPVDNRIVWSAKTYCTLINPKATGV